MQKFFLLTMFFMISTVATAQYGGYGSNRSTNYSDMMSRTKRPSKKNIEKSKAEFIEKSVERLKKELTLDDLQVIAIRKIIEEDQKNRGIIIANQTISEESKIEEIRALNESTDRKLLNYLSEEQQEKYKLLK